MEGSADHLLAVHRRQTSWIWKIRHILTDKLLADGGTIGYSIRPGQRNKGFGKILLSELIKECSDMGIEKALLTIHKTIRHPLRQP